MGEFCQVDVPRNSNSISVTEIVKFDTKDDVNDASKDTVKIHESSGNKKRM
jgi:hypothetical protein